MTTNQQLNQLADLAEELTQPRQHIERMWERDSHRNKRTRRVYVTTQPGLLRQLAEAVHDTSTTDEKGGGRSVPGSRPPGSWEAIAQHAAITVAVARWCWDLDLPQRDTVEANIHQLVGNAPRLDPGEVEALLADMRSWRHQAAVMTGWASPAFAPSVPCVVCGKRNTLRINLERRSALCINPDRDEDDRLVCGAAWDAETIGVLAAYISSVTEKPTAQIRVRSGKAGNGAWLTGPVGNNPCNCESGGSECGYEEISRSA